MRFSTHTKMMMSSSSTVLALMLLTISNTLTAFVIPELRIVGGYDSNIERFPFMVSLRDSAGINICGATLLNNTWALTAAHCVVDKQPNELSIQYGVTEISIDGPNIVNIKTIIVHEEYDPADSYANDIALLELTETLLFDYLFVAPVQLPVAYYEVPQTHEGTDGILLGWGRNESDGMTQTTLQQVNLKIYSDKECSRRSNVETQVNQICAGVDAGDKGQCKDDSGGPLLYNNYIQLGIVSWSISPCIEPHYPGIYTKVSHYIDWIVERVNVTCTVFP